MKRLVFLTVLGLAVVAFVVGVSGLSYQNVRPRGVNTPSDGSFYLVCDSTDTLQIDTFYSDTVSIGGYKYINYKLDLMGFNLADSANDSVVIVVKGIGSIDGQYPITVITDTIPTTLGTLDSTTVITGIVKIDTLPLNRLYFETVVKDSFIMGAGIDSSLLQLRYGVIQIISTDR